MIDPGAKSDLTAQVLRHLIDYDPLTGRFSHKTNRQGCVLGKKAGYIDTNGYIKMRILGKVYSSHRVAWLHYYGHWPRFQIDHINGDKSDNRIINLRDVTPSTNTQNIQRRRSDNASGYTGVTKNGSGWRAVIKASGRVIHLGTFSTPELASNAYQVAKSELHHGAIAAARARLQETAQ